jgi:hypothetical protein
MRSNSSRIIAGIICACLVIGLVAVYLVFPRTPVSSASSLESSTIGQTSSSSGGFSFSSGASQNGLELVIDLNSTTIQPREAIDAQIELVNTLGENVSVQLPPFSETTNYWEWSQQDSDCGVNPSNFLVDYAVFKGHFSAQNISEAGNQLLLAPAWAGPCNGYTYYNAVTFLPNGDVTNYTEINYSQPQLQTLPSYVVKAEANATTYYCTGTDPIDCGNSAGLVGYWNDTITTTRGLASPALSYFPPGQYTIVATDPWNQYVYVNFTVDADP